MKVSALADGKDILVAHGMGRMVMVKIVAPDTDKEIFAEIFFGNNLAAIVPGWYSVNEFVPYHGPVVIYITEIE